MRPQILVHIVAGSLGILTGFVALYATKGGRVHRRSGMVFVYAMLVMAVTGAMIAAIGGNEGSVIGGVLTAYLVVTAFTAVRPPAADARRTDVMLMLAALTVAIGAFLLGADALGNPNGARKGIPAPVFFMFGTMAMLACIGDARMIRAGGWTGTRRIARHLWRMCYALWIASMSFFIGQMKVFPKPLRVPALLMLPAMIALVAMLYWLWRLRVRRTLRGLVRVAPVLEG